MIILLVIGLFILSVFDALLVAYIVVNLIKKSLGDTPLSRLLRLFAGIISCGLYGYWAIYKTSEFLASTENISPAGMIVPLAMPLCVLAILYIANGTKQ